MSKLQWIEVPGASLAVEHQADDGASDMPVLFLHANVADRRMWHGQWSALTPAHPVASYDRRGFGDSRTLHPTPHSNVADLWALMDSLATTRLCWSAAHWEAVLPSMRHWLGPTG